MDTTEMKPKDIAKMVEEQPTEELQLASMLSVLNAIVKKHKGHGSGTLERMIDKQLDLHTEKTKT